MTVTATRTLTTNPARTVVHSFRAEPELLDRLRTAAARSEVSRGHVIRRGIHLALDEIDAKARR